jgi:L1 cell adhesion molecule like protein
VKKQLTIQNDRNRLSKEEIEKMISEAEKYKKDDEEWKERLDAKNQLEQTLFHAKQQFPEEPLIKEGLEWLETHQEATKEEYTEKCQTIAAKLVEMTKDSKQAEDNIKTSTSTSTPTPTTSETSTPDIPPVIEEVD